MSTRTASPSDASASAAERASERRRVGRNSLVMASGTLASRLTGQIRTIMLTAAIGVTGIAADAYQVGSQIPQVLYNIISGGLINAILVPQIVRTFQKSDYRDRLNKLLTFSGVVLIGFTLLLTASTPLLVDLYVNSGWTGPQKALANAFTLWCMPQILFYGIYTIVGQVLAARDRFGMYAWSSVAANIISIIGFTAFLILFGNAQKQPLSFWTPPRITLLAGSWTAGIAVQAFLLFIPLHKIGIHPRVKWGLHGFGLRSMGRVGMWTLGMVVLDQIFGIVTTRLTTGAPVVGHDRYGIAGSQAYQQAFQIYILPYSLIVVSVATAIFPVLSRAAARHEIDRFREQLSHAIRMCVVIMTFFAAGFIAYPIPIIKAVLPSVGIHDAKLMSLGLVAIALNLPLASVTLLMRRSFFAFEDGRDQFFVSAILDVVGTIVLGLGFLFVQPYYWIAVASASGVIGRIVMLPVEMKLMSKKLNGDVDGKRIAFTSLRVLIAGAICVPLGMLLCSWSSKLVGAQLTGAHLSMRWWQSLVVLLICGVVSLVVYVVLLKVLRVEEVTSVLTLITRRLHLTKHASNTSSTSQTPAVEKTDTHSAATAATSPTATTSSAASTTVPAVPAVPSPHRPPVPLPPTPSIPLTSRTSPTLQSPQTPPNPPASATNLRHAESPRHVESERISVPNVIHQVWQEYAPTVEASVIPLANNTGRSGEQSQTRVQPQTQAQPQAQPQSSARAHAHNRLHTVPPLPPIQADQQTQPTRPAKPIQQSTLNPPMPPNPENAEAKNDTKTRGTREISDSAANKNQQYGEGQTARVIRSANYAQLKHPEQ